ncbi:sodium-dependent lysophosphatidylcholine symporter 1-like isoform X2 [Triplophysa rosa]|uniref:sodium-dependent lysophosphatidylcholine symporter 1-like isoform X2 n=1 Tax=Triplophysa rosa TaxID=992332 RepID=UPI002545FFA9|nr:sodium-dependent lysophosphatidylcholine symporter 1-like isoform X2 [Triplophysa rosa]
MVSSSGDHHAAENMDCAAENDNRSKATGIPLSRKLCYAIGGMPYQMTSNAKGFFMQIFLLDVVKMGASYASIILFLGRAWDAVTDPMIGYAVSKSRRTRFGKLIPWIVFSMPFGVVSYIMLWYTPQDTMSPAFSFCWYFVWCCLFDTFMSCYHVPYSSLNMFLGGNDRDRDSATGYRMGMEVFATLAGAAIQGQIVGMYHAKRSQVCSMQNDTDVPAANHTASLSDTTENLQNTTAATLSTPLWQTVLVKLGKKTTIFIGLFTYIPTLIIISLLRNSLPVFIIMSVLAGTSLSALYLLPWSMLPDVVDDFKVKNPSCQDLEPLFYSCYVFFNKFGGGVAVGISTLVLHFAGYKPGVCKHNSQVIFSLQMLFAPVPICLLLIGMVMFYFYPITEKRRQEIQTALKKAAEHPKRRRTEAMK